ncbi:MAG: formylglycine-generating enzyme family protein [Planctomycetota bacterium]|jgi:formylglycine-generating enzyme required for sulfatase activity
MNIRPLVFLTLLGLTVVGGVNTLATPETPTELKASTEPSMVNVPAGSVHSKSLGQISAGSFLLAKFEVSRNQWQRVQAWVNNATKSKYDPFTALASDADTAGLPVAGVSWYEAVRWCNALSEMEGLTPVYLKSDGISVWRKGEPGHLRRNMTADGYRLPTEAEWELAYRAGRQSKFFWGDDETIETVSRYGWYTKNADKKPRPVGTVEPNPLGLYDMAGNVSEWCWDAVAGPYRIWRGGSCATYPDELAASCRHSHGLASVGMPDVGFRIARNRN